jgi:outer membrane lipoprotein SlyB
MSIFRIETDFCSYLAGGIMKAKYTLIATLVVAATALAGCANPNSQAPTTSAPAAAPEYSSATGVIDSIQAVPASSGNTSGVGTVAGGVVGGVLGNQVGGGRGRTAATIAGAVGGAMAGNAMEHNSQAASPQVYQIGVRLDNGSYQTIQQDSVAGLSIGSRVRVENGRVYSY